MKTKEELNAIKEEIETLNKKLAELTEDELKQVVGGGTDVEFVFDNPSQNKEFNLYKNTVDKDFTPKFPTGSDT